MTVNYTADVANGSNFGCFWKLLARWKGSVYKLVWRELMVYLFLYFSINISYRFGMSSEQRSAFEKVKVYCSRQIESIPMSFVLGFYVTLIVKRWWDQYWILPLPDSVALFISSSIHGQDERGRILRRTIMRYTVLAYIIMLQRISFRVKKRFPTFQHLVDSGLMMESEKQIFDKMNEKAKVNKFWIPIIWSTNLVNRARSEGRITSDHMVQSILNELSEFRRRLGRVAVYDNISVPLVYTQVVTLAVYTYFTAALMGHQWVSPYDAKVLSTIYPAQELDLYFPIFLCLQFVFYIGWLKVAETLINPFGEDDDDFEINWLIDRHLQVSYLVVDEIHEEHPELLKDQYWDQVVPQQLPYNLASENFRRREPLGSTASMKIKEKDTVYDHLTPKRHASMIPDEVYADYESVTDSPLVDGGRKSWIQRQLSRVESFRSTSSSSSLFNRNRGRASGHNHQNGGLHLQGAGGHRLSLYERLMSRRSSKEQNAMRFSYQNRNNENKENLNTSSLAIPSHATRPRVPTPEVIMKETSLMPTDPKFMNTRPVSNAPSPRQLSPGSIHSNYGGSGLYHGRVLPTVFGQHNNIPSPRSKSPLSSLYDTNENSHIMLSPIEENDGSPYSTSSTSRSVKSSSNYPTTTSIFGRKPSPPPPQEELPPIPTEKPSQPSSGSNGGGNRPDTHIVDMMGTQNMDESMTFPKKLSSASLSIDRDERYMTISEVSDMMNSTETPSNNNSDNNASSMSKINPDTSIQPPFNVARERKQSVITRQNALISEEHPHDSNNNTNNNGNSIEPSQNDNDNFNSSAEDGDKTEIMLTNEVLQGHPTVYSANGDDSKPEQKIRDINNSLEPTIRSASASEVNSSLQPDGKSRKISETSNNSRRISESSGNNPNINTHRKISDISNQSLKPRKISEGSHIPRSFANSRKVSDISNNGNSRKVSDSSSTNLNSRKTSEVSRKISEVSDSEAGSSRKISDISNASSNNRKISDISFSNSSLKEESGPSSVMSDSSRKSSESSTSSPCTIADQNIEFNSDSGNNSSLSSCNSSTSLSQNPKNEGHQNGNVENGSKNLFEVFV